MTEPTAEQRRLAKQLLVLVRALSDSERVAWEQRVDIIAHAISVRDATRGMLQCPALTIAEEAAE